MGGLLSRVWQRLFPPVLNVVPWPPPVLQFSEIEPLSVDHVHLEEGARFSSETEDLLLAPPPAETKVPEQSKLPEETKLFEPTRNAYERVLVDNANGFDLVETIDPETYEHRPHHSYVRLRKNNNTFSIFDTQSLATWLTFGETHPETRQNIRVAIPRILKKKQWATQFSERTADITDLFQDAIWDNFLVDENNPLAFEKAAAFVDLRTLQRSGFIHDLSFEESKTALEDNGWLLRFSSKHHDIPPHTALVVVVVSSVNRGVVQARLMLVDGVGVFQLRGSNIPMSVSYEMFTSQIAKPCAHLLQAIQMSTNNRPWRTCKRVTETVAETVAESQ